MIAGISRKTNNLIIDDKVKYYRSKYGKKVWVINNIMWSLK